MKVEIYAGLGTQRQIRWKGDLEVIPRVGDEVVTDKAGDRGYTVERVTHWVALKKIEIYVR
jgi:hypothetical protein